MPPLAKLSRSVSVRLRKTANQVKNSLFRTSRAELISFRCNICGSPCFCPISELRRETPSCAECGSTPRYRAVIRLLSTELFGKSLVIADFPVRKDIRGLGLSDWEGYASRLEKKFSFTTTYLHREPRLDIRQIEGGEVGRYDFVISSEVFEHVQPPVSRAFQETRRLLKDTGFLVCTVPYITEPGAGTREHFPDLHDFRIEERDGHRVLVNKTAAGEVQVFENLIFHGGDGLSLEMRVFSEAGLLDELQRAGFREVEVYREPDLQHGVYWPETWSLPIVARVSGRSGVVASG